MPRPNLSVEDVQRCLAFKVELKAKQTFAEKAMLRILRGLKLKVVQQHVYTPYIVDFFLPKPYKVMIEVDGKYHDFQEQRDEKRAEYLLQNGRRDMLRFTNDAVIHHPDVVRQQLIEDLGLTI